MPMLLFYRLLFTAELFTAEFLFVYRLRKRKLFILRFAGCLCLGFAFAAVLPLFYNAFYTTFTFLLLSAATVPMLAFCCRTSWKNVFFCVIAAYTMQHFAYGAANFLLSVVRQGISPIFGMYFEGNISFENFDGFTVIMILLYILAYYVSYVLFYVIFVRKIKRGKDFRIRNAAVMGLVGLGLVVDVILNAVSVFYSDSTNFVTVLMNTVYESLCCIFLMYIQFELIRTGDLKNELYITQSLLREKERQYNLSKENVELINLKCHDLRHQIRAVGKGKGLSAETVREIERTISIYDAEVRTDNEVLDIILTEKSLKCKMNDISLTCIADGKSLAFMEDTDVYALFGNALDNAIEAVMRLEKDKRNIGVVVRAKDGIVSVSVRNNYQGEIRLNEDGLPLTGKQDKNFHGFGMRSMCQIAEKYHGACSVSLNNQTFNLNILLSNVV